MKSAQFVMVNDKGSVGFHIGCDAGHGLVRIRAWGWWNLEMGNRFRHTLDESVCECHFDLPDWQALVELQDWYPQSDAVMELMAQTLLHVKQAGAGKIGYIGKSDYIDYKLPDWFRAQYLEGAAFSPSLSQAVARDG